MKESGGSARADPPAVSASSVPACRGRGPARGPRRAGFWRGGEPTDVHCDSDERGRLFQSIRPYEWADWLLEAAASLHRASLMPQWSEGLVPWTSVPHYCQQLRWSIRAVMYANKNPARQKSCVKQRLSFAWSALFRWGLRSFQGAPFPQLV